MRATPEGPLVLNLESVGSVYGYLQPFAGGQLWSAFRLDPDAVPGRRPPSLQQPVRPAWSRVYDGPGLVEGRLQRLVSWFDADSGFRRVDFDEGESFLIGPGGASVTRRSARRDALPRLVELALGGPIALALACRGVHLLHASAFETGGRVLALTAQSGGGKSTLAAAAARRGFRRVADDQLPVRLGERSVALPHFPQLKLLATERYPAAEPVALPLFALVELEHVSGLDAPRLERLAKTESLLALARATVASRLFDPELMSAHFETLAAAVDRLAVARLTYPSGLDRLDAALEALLAWEQSVP